jgi:hypothetical protein
MSSRDLAWAQAYEQATGPIGWERLDALVLWLAGIVGMSKSPAVPYWWNPPKEEPELIVDEEEAHQKRLEIGSIMAEVFGGVNPEEAA